MSSAAAKKQSEHDRPKSTGRPTAVAKVPQPHGGALNSGGTPGNRGGSGPTPSALRLRLRGALAERVPIIEAFADGVAPLSEKCPKCGYEPTTTDVVAVTPSDRLRALDMMAKYSIGEKNEITLVSPEITQRLQQQVDVINSRDSWTPSELRDALTPIWSTG